MTAASESSQDTPSPRVFQRDIAPYWHDRFAKALLGRPFAPALLSPGTRALDLHCTHGYSTFELAKALPDDATILALEPDAALMDSAQRKLLQHRQKVQFRCANFDEVTVLPSAHFNLVCANLVLGQAVPNWQQGLGELARVLAPEGEFRASMALAGTWSDATQIVLKVLSTQDAQWAHEQLLSLQSRWPTPSEVLKTLQTLAAAPDDVDVEVLRFELLFANARDFFGSPLIEQGPLSLWRALLRGHEDQKAILWRLREAFDAYYEGHALALPVVVGVATLRKHADPATKVSPANERLARYPQLCQLHQRATSQPALP